MDSLTKKQSRLIRFIQDWQESKGYAPSTYEIAAHFKVVQTAVMNHLRALEKKGVLQRSGDKRRARVYDFDREKIPISQRVQKGLGANTLPLYESIPAGSPNTISEAPPDFLEFSAEWFGRGDLVAVKVVGDSMSEDAIHTGDVAIIKLQKEANPKDIVAVRVQGSEVTLKHIKRKLNKIELIASNPAYKVRTIPAEEAEIIGKLIGILRKY